MNILTLHLRIINSFSFSPFLSLSLSLCLSLLYDQDGATPTYIAAQNGHVEALELLCKHGADVNKSKQASAQSRLLPLMPYMKKQSRLMRII